MRTQTTGGSFAFVQALMRRAAGLARAWRRLIGNPYRPEKHYMRGPGPKVREKYAHVVARRPSDGSRGR